MKKLLKSTVLVAATFAFGCAAVACGDTDDGDKNPPSEPTKYTVSYAIGDGATGTAPAGGEYEAGAKFNIAAATGFEKDGYTFNGWLCSGDSVTYDAGAEFEMPAYKVTFTAQWEEVIPAPKYSVTYVLGEGVTGTAPTGASYEAGETVTVASGAGLTKDGYKFIGWNNGTITYSAGQTFTMPAKSVTLTSEWVEYNPGVTYTVTVVKSSVESQISSVVGEIPTIENKAAGDEFTIPADTFSFAHYHQTKWRVQHYTGEYWDTDANYDLDANIIMPDHSIRIAPVWAANEVTISFDANGGSGAMNAVTKNFGTNLALTTAAFDCKFTAPAGKKFQGWAISANGAVIENGTKLDATIVSETDTLTLYAVWEEKPAALEISEIAGHWTDATNTHTFDIIADDMGS
ncbi:MAG: InlB B-repeat-containing protein, partial [Clostridiales bacterium]|nr:InlB B-repeat-containing protein [Clostridiales bacterium]